MTDFSCTLILALGLILPGLPIAYRIVCDHAELEAFDLLILAAMVSAVEVAFFSYILAVAGHFTLEGVWFLLGIATVSGLALTRTRTLPRDFLSRGRIPIFVCALLGFVAILTLPAPSEWMSGYHLDVGRYSNSASLILHRGSIVLKNELTDPGLEAQSLKKSDLYKIPGYFPKRATQQSSFVAPYLHLYPSLLAFVRGHVGTFGSFSFNWYLAFLAATAFYLLNKICFKVRSLALAGALFLFTNPAVQLYANTTMTEILTLILVLFAFLLLLFFEKFQTWSLAVLSAGSFFLLAICRLEFGLFYFAPALTYLLSIGFLGHKPPRHFSALFIIQLLTIPILAHYYHTMAGAYVVINIERLLHSTLAYLKIDFEPWRYYTIRCWALVESALIVSCLLLSQFLMRKNVRDRASTAANILACSYGLFLFYNFTLRPLAVQSLPPTDAIRWEHEPVNLIRLLSFVDPLTILCGVAGGAHLLRKVEGRVFALFALGFTFILITKSGHSTPILWWSRRYIPIVIPGLYFLALGGLSQFRPAVAWAVIVAALTYNISADIISFRQSTEQRGTYAFYSDAAKAVSPTGVQTCFEGDVCSQSALPVHSHFNIDTIYFRPGLTDTKIQFFKSVLKQGRPVFIVQSDTSPRLLTGTDRKMLASNGLTFKKVYASHFSAAAWRGFKGEWRPGLNWRALYTPAIFSGLYIRDHQFQIALYRIEATDAN